MLSDASADAMYPPKRESDVSLLDFLASIVGSIAWPSAMFASVYLFRRELVPLLPLLRVRHKDWDVGFDRLEDAGKTADHFPPPPPDALPPPTSEVKDTFEQLVEHHPRAAILDARADLEQAVREAAVKLGIDNASDRTLTSLIRSMGGRVPDEVVRVLESLRQLGNNAAHNADTTSITPHEARLFRSIADKVIASLAGIRKVRRDIA